MKLVPEKWTHHHTHRLFHLSSFFIFCYILALSAWGGSLAFRNANADQEDVFITAAVPDISIDPSISPSGGESFINPVQPVPDPKIVPVIEPIDAPLQEILVDGKKEFRALFEIQYPKFSGTVPYKNTLLFITIHSEVTIRATTYTDEHGHWSWTSPEAISPGPHEIILFVQDLVSGGLKQIASLKFFISIPSTQRVLPSPRPGALTKPQPDNQGTLFDVVVKIPEQFKHISPGDDLIATIGLINFGKAGSPVDVGVKYTITDEKNNIIAERTETVAVATRLSFLKSFSISPGARSGVYTLTVQVPSEDILAISSDIFEVKSPEVTLVTTVNATVLFQGLMGLGLLSIMVLYLEYNKISILSRVIRQVSEEDLKKEM